MHAVGARLGATTLEDARRGLHEMGELSTIPRYRTQERRILEMQLQWLEAPPREAISPPAQARSMGAQPSGSTRRTPRCLPGHALRAGAVRAYGVEPPPQAPPGGPPVVVHRDKCQGCGLDLKLHAKKSILVCDSCGYSETYVDTTTNALPYKSNVEISNFSYKKINHFNEWLMQIQGKENRNVPPAVIDQVKESMIKKGIRVSDATTHMVREELKVLKMSRLYHHVAQITSQVSGKPPPTLSVEIEEKCRMMFVAIQEPFEMHCPPHRKNFLSYPYCLFKFLELLGERMSLSSFILLKGKDKLLKQDQIFEKICHSLNWEFIPSALKKP
jgi:hypothetical protein